jgi:hypothetical protein
VQVSTARSRDRSLTDTGLIPDGIRAPLSAGDAEPGDATLEQELLALAARIEDAGAGPCLVCGTEARLHDRCPGCGSILD